MSTVNGFQVGSETLKYNYESLDNYNTPNFSTSSSATYAVGDYVMYNGKLYKCTTATTGGTWVSSNWTEAVLSDDVNDLSRQLSDLEISFDADNAVLYSRTTRITIPGSQVSASYYLDGTGRCVSASGYKLMKWQVTPGSLIWIRAAKETDGVYQFQSSSSVPSSLPNANLIGTPVTVATDKIVLVPSGATWLIISALLSNAESGVYNYVNRIDKTNAALSAFEADSKANFDAIAYKTGADLYMESEHVHGTTLNQANTQTDIVIPKNWSVTLTVTDSVTQGKNASVYVKYKGDGSSTLLPSNVSLDGGSITFVTAKETEFISLYQAGVLSGTLTIKIATCVLGNLVGLPTYYQDHMVNKTAEILDNMMTAGMNGETFVFISDLHWENNDRNSPALVGYLLDNLNINFLLCGGDLINEGDKATMSQTMVECIRAFNFKNTFFPCAFGNHDSNKNGSNPSDRWFDANAEYALMQKQAEDRITYFTDTGWNFYFDAEQTKTRWIVCDTQENGAFAWYAELCALLNNTPKNYHIIISGHWFYDSGAKSSFATNLESIVDAFNAKTSATISGLTYDFSDSNGAIPFVIGGHMHNDMDWTTTNGIPFILVDCDNGPRSGNTDYPYAKGTITEQAFDVVTVDYANATIKCVRIGRGTDRDFTF